MPMLLRSSFFAGLFSSPYLLAQPAEGIARGIQTNIYDELVTVEGVSRL